MAVEKIINLLTYLLTYLLESLAKMYERHTVAALHQGAPGQMTWLEEPPPLLRPAHCFASFHSFWQWNKTISGVGGLCF